MTLEEDLAADNMVVLTRIGPFEIPTYERSEVRECNGKAYPSQLRKFLSVMSSCLKSSCMHARPGSSTSAYPEVLFLAATAGFPPGRKNYMSSLQQLLAETLGLKKRNTFGVSSSC